MTFKTIHTTHGLQAMAAAEASGVPVNLVQMAVGDGNGNFVNPVESQTNLVREMFRANVNRIFQDPTVSTRYTAELVIPASAGGFTLREVGIFDADGGLFAVGNLPDTYKPNVSEGAYADTVVRIEFLVSNAGVVTLVFDPNVTIVTRTWIANNVTAATLFPGGTTHQVLRKHSNADGDTEWADPSDVNVLVNTVEEVQTLAAGQTVVNLALTTTQGLAVYIEGVRLPKAAGVTGWQPDGAISTRLTLGKSYVAGTQIICVQNEPASSLTDPLAKAQNLADLPDKAVARNNLDVFSKAEAAQLQPISAVAYFPRSTAPTGWLKANGAAISRTAYANLFAVIGATFGAGDGFTTFNLPDLRGEFLRGWDDSRGIDAGRGIGSAQGGQNLAHVHGVNDPGHTHTGGRLVGDMTYAGAGGSYLEEGQGTPNYNIAAMDSATTGIGIQSSGGNEARPRNVALLACIKF